MRSVFIIVVVSFIFQGSLPSQQIIDGTLAFQNDPAKAYSLYIPSSYEESLPNAAFLGLHPLNTRRWNARSWRDTLISFAESNDLILICPDGGTDGRVDDPVDTAFTTFLLDSVGEWYNVDDEALYVVGFSWGARTTYTYGLRRTNRFAGFMPVGAAINGLNEIGTLSENGKDEKFFIIHGSNDRPMDRFFPVRDALRDAGGCVRDTLLSGVGHTFDFAGRNSLLSIGYQWLKTSSCGTTSILNSEQFNGWKIPNPISTGTEIEIPKNIHIKSIWDLNGNRFESNDPLVFGTSGVYFVHYSTISGEVGIAKMVIGR
ncbi:MAG: hypothetical protein R3275_00370 [Saprospiraceae bacterium]|nr:hypothetical protein [Saprospiraceae bacterium]